MRLERKSMRSRTIHTLVGPITVSSDEHADALLAPIALDAVRVGRGSEHPWYVDDRGRPTKQLPAYIEILSPFALQLIVKEGSPVAKTQAMKLEEIMVSLAELASALEEVPMGSVDAIVDPVVRFLVVREFKDTLATIAPFVDPTGALNAAVELVPNELPTNSSTRP